MKKLTFLFFFLASQLAMAQNIYQPHEVEIVAEPQGGVVALRQFSMDNLQIPFQARIKGIKGRVFVNGVVEVDGSFTDAKVVRGINPACNQEAIRVMSLYKAWKPAQKEGKAVRQAVIFIVDFPLAPVADYDSTAKAIVRYYNKNLAQTINESEYAYKYICPLDNKGFPRDIVQFINLKSPKNNISIPVIKAEVNYFVEKNKQIVDTIKAVALRVQDDFMRNYASNYIFQKNEKLLNVDELNELFQKSHSLRYDLSGMLVERNIYSKETIETTEWYDNGQKRIVKTFDEKLNIKVLNYFANDGTQMIIQGNGYYRGVEGSKEKPYVEYGNYKNGLKEGMWFAKFADSTVYYAETYIDGNLVSGYAVHNGKKTEYKTLFEDPSFYGGKNALNMFLAKNMKFPPMASRQGISGKVALSFTINIDGTIENIEVLQSIGGGCDEEAVRVVKAMNGKWIPAKERGKAVRVKYNLPVSFVLE